MKKITAYIALFLLIIIFIISSSAGLMEKITAKRWVTESIIWRSDGLRFGDLFYISFLSKFKIVKQWNPEKITTDSASIDLYEIGDSYLKDVVDKQIYKGVDSLTFVDWRYDAKPICLRKNKRNVLIIETTERHFRNRFSDSTNFKFQFVADKNYKKKVNALKQSAVDFTQFLFNKNREQNLEFNLFDYPVFTKIKTLKADFTYNVFNRHSPEVEVADNGEMLYLSATTDSLVTTSSFCKLNDAEINKMTLVANAAYRYYKNLGFDEIIFTVVPNPVSISGYHHFTYNNLISRFEAQNKNFVIIDLYNDFKSQPIAENYFKSDSHWNTHGLQHWLNKVNTELEKK